MSAAFVAQLAQLCYLAVSLPWRAHGLGCMLCLELEVLLREILKLDEQLYAFEGSARLISQRCPVFQLIFESQHPDGWFMFGQMSLRAMQLAQPSTAVLVHGGLQKHVSCSFDLYFPNVRWVCLSDLQSDVSRLETGHCIESMERTRRIWDKYLLKVV